MTATKAYLFDIDGTLVPSYFKKKVLQPMGEQNNWIKGFQNKSIVTPIVPDMVQLIRSLRNPETAVATFSKGSLLLQKILLQHTDVGDILEYFDFHFEAKELKKENQDSYHRIAESMKVDIHQITYYTDTIEEFQAAKRAGMNCVLVAWD